jgi:hypothetical protein
LGSIERPDLRLFIMLKACLRHDAQPSRRVRRIEVETDHTVEKAQDFDMQWLWTRNDDRPNMGIGGITPARKQKVAA